MSDRVAALAVFKASCSFACKPELLQTFGAAWRVAAVLVEVMGTLAIASWASQVMLRPLSCVPQLSSSYHSW